MAFIKSDFIKNSGVLFSSTGIAQLISLLIIPILSRIYTPAEHGVITLFTAIVSVCIAFSSLRYEQAIVVEEDRKKAIHLVALSIFLSLVWCFIFYLVILLFQSNIYHFFKIESGGTWLILVPITVVFGSVTETMVMWFNRERRYKKLAGNRVVGIALGSGYKLAHPYLTMLKGNGLVIGHVLGQALQMILLTPIKKLKRIHIDLHILKEVAQKYKSFPKLATPSALVNIIGSYMTVFIISSMLGEKMTGFYGNAIKLTFIPLSGVSYAVGQVYFERLARLKTDTVARIALSMDLLKFLFLLAVIPVCIMMIWGDVLVPFILGDAWEVSGTITQITVFYFFAMYLSSPFSAAFEVFDGLGRQLWFTGTFTIVTTLALYLGFKFSGSLYVGLIIHAFVGIVIRTAMLYDCFKIIGKQVYFEILKGILIVAGVTLLGVAIKFMLA